MLCYLSFKASIPICSLSPVPGPGTHTGFRVVNRTDKAPWYEGTLFWLDFCDSCLCAWLLPWCIPPITTRLILLKSSGLHGLPYCLRVRVTSWASPLYLPCHLGLFHVSHPVHLGWSICRGLNMPHGPSLCASVHASPSPEMPALLFHWPNSYPPLKAQLHQFCKKTSQLIIISPSARNTALSHFLPWRLHGKGMLRKWATC